MHSNSGVEAPIVSGGENPGHWGGCAERGDHETNSYYREEEKD